MVLRKSSRTVVAAAFALAVVLSGCAAVPLAGDDLTAKEIGERAQEKYDSIDSYEGTLTTSMQSGETNQTTTAEVWVKPHSNEMRYEYTSGSMSGNIMVSNGSVMWMYNETENSAQRMDISGFGADTTTMNYSQVFENTFENYDISHEGSATVGDRSTHVITLTPKENGTMAEFVEEQTLWIDKNRWFPVKTRMTATFDNETMVTTTEYTNLSFDTEIPDSTFEFEPPADATVEENEMPDMEQYESVADANAATSVDVTEPTDLPDDYEFTRAMVTNASEYESVSLTYENESDTLSVRQSTQTTADGDADETVSVNGREATVQSFGETTILSWTCDDRTYTVTGTLSTEALTDVAASIDCE